MTAKRYPEETIARAVELREKGYSYEMIGAELGMNPKAVSWHCLKLGAEPPKPTPIAYPIPMVVKRGNHVVRRFTPEEDATLLAMEAQGAKRSEMCRALGRRSNSIVGRLMTLARYEERRAV